MLHYTIIIISLTEVVIVIRIIILIIIIIHISNSNNKNNNGVNGNNIGPGLSLDQPIQPFETDISTYVPLLPIRLQQPKSNSTPNALNSQTIKSVQACSSSCISCLNSNPSATQWATGFSSSHRAVLASGQQTTNYSAETRTNIHVS